MKKKISALVLVLVMMMSVVVQAAGPAKAPQSTYSFRFSGTTAICQATVRGNNGNDKVSLVLKLWQGAVCLKTWSTSGSGVVSLKKNTSVSRGKNYKMTVDYTVNGVSYPQKSITKTCP